MATAWSAGAGKFANSGVGTIAFGALSGGVGAELAGGNFWQGAVTGGIVAGLNHVMHQMDDPDNGYDENGNQINNKGGDTTDYLYDKYGHIISSTSVDFKGAIPSSGELRGYGFKGFRMASGAITEDNTIANFFIGGKAIEGMFSGLKLVTSPLVIRAGGESTFKIGILNPATKFMVRFEKHSLPLLKGGRAYPVHINVEKLGEYNYHFFINPKNWGKFKVN